MLRGLEKNNNDLERFIESEGMRLEMVNSLRHGLATIRGDMIYVVKDESPIIEKLRTLHELGHVFLHSMCIGYYQTDLIRVIKEEREAQTFATLVLYPSIDNYNMEKDFIAECGMPLDTAKLRINFFRKTGI